jgi:uncharacterized repeat protein (TIGR01451 family)
LNSLVLKSWIAVGLTILLIFIGLRGLENSSSLAKGPVGADKITAANPANPEGQVGAASITISLVQIASNLAQPIQVTHAGDGSGRLFVVERKGLIKIIKNGIVQGTPFLNIDPLVIDGGSEQGLLGLAFHPNYETNGFFYVYYTRDAASSADDGDIVIARYKVSGGDPDVADPASALTILIVDRPDHLITNHNGGQLFFSPIDGYLYLGTGDGGGSNDPGDNAQDTAELLGKILRIDINSGSPYTIPLGNPFAGKPGRDEIWAFGLRNPWRFSFDRANGDLYIGDVGQGVWEEIDYQAVGTPGGLNFGWDIREGPCPTGQQQPCTAAPSQFTDPIAYYQQPSGGNAAVTGGFVYRGNIYPSLVGHYFYADYISGQIWAITKSGSSWTTPQQVFDASFLISAFGEDEAGELYVVNYGSNGKIWRIVGPDANLTTSVKSASPISADPGEAITYTIYLHNTGALTPTTAFLTDQIPAGLAYEPGTLAASFGTVDDSASPILKWQGSLASTPDITITYVVTATGLVTGNLTNTAVVTSAATQPVTLTHTIRVPKFTTIIYLPLFLKNSSPN